MLFHSDLISNPKSIALTVTESDGTVSVWNTKSDRESHIRFVWPTTRDPEAIVIIEMVHDIAISVKLYPTDKAREVYLGLLNAGRKANGTGWMVHDSTKLVLKDDMHMALRMLRLNAPGF